MKNANVKFSIILSALLFIISCSTSDDINGPVTTVQRDLADFVELEMRGVGKIEIVSGAESNYIEITTHVHIVDNITTNVSDGKLIIDMNGDFKDVDKLEFMVYTTADLIAISQFGVGDIYHPGPTVVDDLKVKMEGVGNIDIASITANTIEAQLKDVGNISLSGLSDSIFYSLTGVGNIEAIGLESKNGEVRLHGVGNIEVFSTDKLKIIHDGVGKVYYKGSPELDIVTNNNIIGVD